MALQAVRSGQSSEKREAFGAYVCDDETAALIAPLAEEHGWPAERVHKGGIANAVRSLSVMRSPEFLIVDLSESNEPQADINALADVCEPGTLVLAIGSRNDVQLYRDLLASGIHDYLLKPVNVADLRESVALALAAMAEPPPAPVQAPVDKRRIGVVGVRGGVGASMMAAAMAWILSDEMRHRVALLDLDLHFGTGALAFDLEPGRGLCDALENPNRVDSLFIERAMLKVNDSLAVLGSEAPLSDPLSPDPNAMQHLLDALADSFDIVLMDMPRMIAGHYPEALANVTDIVIVTDLSLAATRDTIRMLAFFKDHAPEAKLHLVANKVPPVAMQEVSQKDFETSVEREIDFIIPFDAKSAVLSAKSGKTLPQSAPGSKPVAQIRELARRLGTTEAAAAKPSLLSRILRKTS